MLIAGISFQYALMIPTYQVEQQAMKKASLYASTFHPEKQEIAQQQFIDNYLDSISNKVIFSIPYLNNYTYNDLKARQLKLGLDLKGGLQLGLGFDMTHFIKNLAEQPSDLIFLKALEVAKQKSSFSPEHFISTFFKVYQQNEQEQKIFEMFAHHSMLKHHLKGHHSLAKLVQTVHQISDEVIHRTKFMLQQRVNVLGLNQAILVLDESRKLILLEIPGLKNTERIKELLLPTASLEFWETYRITDPGILQAFLKADQFLKDEMSRSETVN